MNDVDDTDEADDVDVDVNAADCQGRVERRFPLRCPMESCSLFGDDVDDDEVDDDVDVDDDCESPPLSDDAVIMVDVVADVGSVWV